MWGILCVSKIFIMLSDFFKKIKSSNWLLFKVCRIWLNASELYLFVLCFWQTTEADEKLCLGLKRKWSTGKKNYKKLKKKVFQQEASLHFYRSSVPSQRTKPTQTKPMIGCHKSDCFAIFFFYKLNWNLLIKLLKSRISSWSWWGTFRPAPAHRICSISKLSSFPLQILTTRRKKKKKRKREAIL